MVSAGRAGASRAVAGLVARRRRARSSPACARALHARASAFWDTAELQTVGPLLGTAHPTGFPTYVLLGWLATVAAQPVRRAGVPDEPVRRRLRRGRRGRHGRPRPAPDRLDGRSASPPASGSPDPSRLVDRDPRRAHALHLALVALLLLLLVALGRRRCATPRAGERRTAAPLVAAAVVFGLALGNHSLTLLLAPAVAPVRARGRAAGSGAGRGSSRPASAALVGTSSSSSSSCRCGPARSARRSSTAPETWDGFWYIVLAEQFRGSLVDPFSDLAASSAALVDRDRRPVRAARLLVPLGFVATVVRRPRYALLTRRRRSAITCFFAASYVNAEIERYYLGPVLIAWTWLAILRGGRDRSRPSRPASLPATAPRAVPSGPGRPPRRPSPRLARSPSRSCVPTLVDLPTAPRPRSIEPTTGAARWLDGRSPPWSRTRSSSSWWSYSTPLWYAQHVEGRRPDIAIVDDRTRLDEDLGEVDRRDRREPPTPARLRDPARPARDRARSTSRYDLDALAGADHGLLARLGPREAADDRPRRGGDRAGDRRGPPAASCRTSSRPTTRRRTSRGWSRRRSRPCRRSPTGSRS